MLLRQALRRANEGIARNARGADALVLLCECGDPGCRERIGLTCDEYEVCRRSEVCLLVAPGHDHLNAVFLARGARFVAVQPGASDAGR
jgi:hypothetical protein